MEQLFGDCRRGCSITDMEKKNLELIWELRKKLHSCPEISGQEKKTIQVLKEFLEKYTSMTVVDTGSWLYGIHEEEKPSSVICFRADMDCIVNSSGQLFHGCGHDGHSAALAGLALELERKKTGKNVVLLWQPGEENGQGAKVCRKLIRQLGITEIYGCHNIPGYPEGQLLLRHGVFACASRGMNICLRGKQTHAAYPELGRNPAWTIGELLHQLPAFLKEEGQYQGMVLASVIEIKVGEKNFGISAGEGELSLTIRAHYLEDLDRLQQKIMEFLKHQCAETGLEMELQLWDEFPDTRNEEKLSEKMETLLMQQEIPYTLLEAPMRWSEDFGWYQKECPGVFFGIGAGSDWPGLHTDEFEYNDVLLEKTADIFYLLAETASGAE